MENLRIDDIARRAVRGLPEAARSMRRDIESNFRAVLQASLGKLDLTTRTNSRCRPRCSSARASALEQLELRVAALEKRVKELEQAHTAAAD